MKYLTELAIAILTCLPWLAGIVLAKGAWLTAAAVFFPPYAWYLVIERAMIMAGFV